MKALKWDLTTIPGRYKILERWDFDDIAPRAVLVELEWEQLPLEVRQILKIAP